MYRGFNLSIKSVIDKYLAKGQVEFEINKELVRENLSKFISPDGVLNGTMMQDQWFSSVNADIFISHSHNDENEAINLAGWIKENFDLDCFVDSCIWGNANDLLKTIDNAYCLNAGAETYSYQKRNSSTSHVHLMLSTALTKMIDKAECLIFLNTPNSVTSRNIIEKTASPWIYMELAVGQLLRKPLHLHRRDLIKAFSESEQDQRGLKIEYELGLDKFTELTPTDLNTWANSWRNKTTKRGNALDLLYQQHPSAENNLFHS